MIDNGGTKMIKTLITFKDGNELNNYISKYIEDKIYDIVAYYKIDVIDTLEMMGCTVVDKEAMYIDDINSRDNLIY